MPTYEYECPKGHRFEVLQRMTAKPVAACPKCGARARRKISGGAGFLFKGEGFYVTDYRSDDYKKKASAESGSSPDKAAKGTSEGGSGAKPDAKREAKGDAKREAESAADSGGSKGTKTSGTKTSSDS